MSHLPLTENMFCFFQSGDSFSMLFFFFLSTLSKQSDKIIPF